MIRPEAMLLGTALLLGACAGTPVPVDPPPASEAVSATVEDVAVSDVASLLTVYKSPG